MQNKLLSSRAFDQMVYCSHNSCHLNILWKKGQALIVIHVTDGKNSPRKCILPPCFSTFSFSFFFWTTSKMIFVLFVFMLQLIIFFLSSFLFFKNHDYNHSPSISSLWMQNPDGLADGA